MAPHAPPVLSSSARQAEALFSAAAASLRVAAAEAEALHWAGKSNQMKVGSKLNPFLYNFWKERFEAVDTHKRVFVLKRTLSAC